MNSDRRKTRHANEVSAVVFMMLASAMFLGCSPKLVPLEMALDAVKRDLLKAKVMNITDLVGHDPEASLALTEQIKAHQCFFRKANPLIPVFSKDFTLNLQGTVTLSQNIALGATGQAPTGSLGFGVSDAKTQGLTIPITWTTLDSLPNIYLQQQMSYLERSFGLDQIRPGYSRSFKQRYAESAEDTYLGLTKQIKDLIDLWPTTKENKNCTNEGHAPKGGVVPFQENLIAM